MKGLDALERNKYEIENVDDFIAIKKELKALEIIKEKIMPLVQLYDNRVYDNEDYEYRELTPEEFNLLKEWLCNE